MLIAFLLAMLLPAASLAAQFTIGTDPERLEGAGKVTLNINMTNDSSASMENIVVSGPGVNYAASGRVIRPGESMFFPLTGMAVSEDQLGQELNYTVTWTENGEIRSKVLTTSIGYANELAFNADRKADKTKAVSGDIITLTYTIENTGTIDLREVKITDKKLNRSTPVATAEVIRAGETATFTFNYKMRQETVVSKPVITYVTWSNDTERTYSGIPELSLGLINSQLDIEVEQGTAGPEGTPFTLKLENNGNQTLKKLIVTDDQDNRLNEERFALAVGEERTFEYLATTDSTREVRFIITGVDGAGLDFEDKTDRYPIRAYIDPSLLGLSFRPSFVSTLTGDGTATMHFEIINNGSVEMTDAVLAEAELGTVKEIGTIVPGTDSFDLDLDIGSPRELVFTLTSKDPVGNECVSTAYITAAYQSAISSPTMTPPPSFIVGNEGEDVVERDEENKPVNTLGDSLMTLTVILGILTVIAIIALIAATAKDKKAARSRSRARATAQARSHAAAAQRPVSAPAAPKKSSAPVKREAPAASAKQAPVKREAAAAVKQTAVKKAPAAAPKRSTASAARPAAKPASVKSAPPSTAARKPQQSRTAAPAARQTRPTAKSSTNSGYAPRPYNPGRSFTEESTTRAYPRADVRRVKPKDEK
ncbi:MAG: hypothetical protein IJC67_05410 [Clostridia bacterium]|nr:hypothetical protein [Clostridia bacterium]